MSALLVEEISSERDAQRADFQQEPIQLCGSLEPLKFTEAQCWWLEWPKGPYQTAVYQTMKWRISDLLAGFYISLWARW